MITALFANGNSRTRQKLKELEKQAKADKATTVALRIQGIMLSMDGYTSGDIAKLLRVSSSAVRSWVHLWNDYGQEGLLEGHRRGRTSQLSPEDKERLSNIIESGPIAYGFQSYTWTAQIICQVIQKEFQVSYNPGHVRRLLKQLGFYVRRKETKKKTAAPSKKRKWTRYKYPNLRNHERKQ